MDAYHEIVQNKDRIPAKIEVLDETYLSKMITSDIFIPVHWHRSIEISYIENVEVMLRTGNQETLISNDFTCVNSGDVHSLSVIRTKEKPKAIIVIISYDFIKHYYPSIEEIGFDLQLKKDHTDLKIIYDKIEKIKKNTDDITDISLTICVLEILELLIREYSYKREIYQNKSMIQIKKILDYIHEHYHEELTLSSISEEVHVSKEHFSRQFHHMIGKSFKEYLDSYRLHMAYDDVINFDLSIQEIAYKHGFPNVKSFIRIFTKAYNCTPLKYRNNYNNVK